MKSLSYVNSMIAIASAELVFAISLLLGLASFILPVWVSIQESNPFYGLGLLFSWPITKALGSFGIKLHDAAKGSVDGPKKSNR